MSAWWVIAGAVAAKKSRENGNGGYGGGGGDDWLLAVLLLIVMILAVLPFVLLLAFCAWPGVTALFTVLYASFIKKIKKSDEETSQEERKGRRKAIFLWTFGYVVVLLLNIPWWIYIAPAL